MWGYDIRELCLFYLTEHCLEVIVPNGVSKHLIYRARLLPSVRNCQALLLNFVYNAK